MGRWVGLLAVFPGHHVSCPARPHAQKHAVGRSWHVIRAQLLLGLWSFVELQFWLMTESASSQFSTQIGWGIQMPLFHGHPRWAVGRVVASPASPMLGSCLAGSWGQEGCPWPLCPAFHSITLLMMDSFHVPSTGLLGRVDTAHVPLRRTPSYPSYLGSDRFGEVWALLLDLGLVF